MDKLSLKEKRIKEKFEKDKKTFDNSQFISKHNKKIVHRFIDIATQNRKNKESYPYSYNATRYVIMKRFCEVLNKDIDKITSSTLLKFAQDLELDKIQNVRLKQPQPYSTSYKEKICKVINSFYSYHFGRNKRDLDNLIYNEYGNKILNISSKKRKDKPILTYSNIKTLIENLDDLDLIYYFSTLFDGGFRIEEFLNNQIIDIEQRQGEKQDYFVFKIKEGTKTGKMRYVSLFMFPEIIKRKLNEVRSRKDYSRNSYIINKSPKYFNLQIKKALINILGFDEEFASLFHNHSLRHSSASYYAVYVAEREADIYRRYGWSFGSDEAREYVQLMYSNDEKEEQQFRKSAVYEETKQYQQEIKDIKQNQISDKQKIEQLERDLSFVLDKLNKIQI